MQQIGIVIIYVVVGGAITRTLWYQYKINELSAEMLDATSVRQSNMQRLESVRKEMAGLSSQFDQLKERNNGLRKERDYAEEEQKNSGGIRKEDLLGAKEMGNI